MGWAVFPVKERVLSVSRESHNDTYICVCAFSMPWDTYMRAHTPQLDRPHSRGWGMSCA